MSPESFEELSPDQQLTMLIAMHIRNELEDFHVGHVSDRYMPELNSTIRYAIYDFFSQAKKDDHFVAWLAMMVPSCWEIPGAHPKPEFSGEFLFDGKPITKPTIDNEGPPST